MTAAFDFDGTLVTERNNLYWHLINELPSARWRAVKTAAFVQAMGGLIPGAAAGIVDFNLMYKLLLTATFSGLPVNLVDEASDALADRIDEMLYPEMAEVLDRHASEDRYLVSCNTEPIVAAWCARRGITPIATRLHVARGRYTGLVDGELNRGFEKVGRLRAAGVDLTETTAYGNSMDDEAMLTEAAVAVLVDADADLAQRWPLADAPRIAVDSHKSTIGSEA